MKFETVFAISAADIPDELHDACLDLDISVHCANSLVQIYTDDPDDPDDHINNPFVKWLIEQGWKFPEGKTVGWIGVWGT